MNAETEVSGTFFQALKEFLEGDPALLTHVLEHRPPSPAQLRLVIDSAREFVGEPPLAESETFDFLKELSRLADCFNCIRNEPCGVALENGQGLRCDTGMRPRPRKELGMSEDPEFESHSSKEQILYEDLIRNGWLAISTLGTRLGVNLNNSSRQKRVLEFATEQGLNEQIRQFPKGRAVYMMVGPQLQEVIANSIQTHSIYPKQDGEVLIGDQQSSRVRGFLKSLRNELSESGCSPDLAIAMRIPPYGSEQPRLYLTKAAAEYLVNHGILLMREGDLGKITDKDIPRDERELQKVISELCEKLRNAPEVPLIGEPIIKRTLEIGQEHSGTSPGRSM